MDKKIIMSLETIMGDRFGKYSKYIIQDRALPDVRDGLKPVQRRILYSMYKEGNLHSKPYRKSAKTVGNVIGNYHPHGDTSVYDAMVRLSQDWKMRAPLVDMQGNNGSIDNDPAAAMRYTEARLAPIAEELLQDLDKDTVLMSLNFDDTEYEPTVLPAAYPNLLVNGATGISAGYATEIPPHNLEEVIDATIYRIKHPKCTLEKIMDYIKGPDFPTGAIVEGKQGILSAFKTGKGKVIVRSKTEIVEEKNMNKIVISEIPYEVNKSELVRKIDEIRFNRHVDGIIEVRDESDRSGLRIVVDLKKDISVQNTLNYLYKNTDLQKNYNYNMVAIKDKRPVLMGILEILDGYIAHQIDVVTRSCQYDLNKANNRKHIVEGLIKAISILDDVVKTIRQSKDKADAKKNLIAKYDFTEKQAEAIVMLQLYRLTNTDIVTLENENKQLDEQITYLQSILNSESVLHKVIIDRLNSVKKKYPMPRLSKIRDEIQEIKIDEQAMILSEDTNVSITRDGYIKRISTRSLKASEGTPFGKKENDYLVALYKANTLDHLLLFTDAGNYLFVPVYKIDEFKWKDAGKHISYLIKLNSNEKIIGSILVKDFNLPLYVLLATKNGQIKRTALSEFKVSRYTKPLKCIKLKDNDQVIGVKLTDNNQGVVLTTKAGYGILYSEQEVSTVGIKAAGVKAANLKNDELVSLNIFNPMANCSLIVISDENGIKRIKISDITPSSRTKKGVLLYKNPKSKIINVKDAKIVDNNQEFSIILNDQTVYSYKATDFNYANLVQKPTVRNKLTKIQMIGDVYIDKPITTDDYHLEQKIEVDQKVFEQPKERTLLDDLKDNADEKKSQDNNQTKYEKISLADLLNEDDF
ncbi:DNA topoisomerase IV subunit A [Erysipelatoclostridium sp. An173]|uniref:DNA topoisomerase IV subunit A n=1 Tax=Erysipelatoclostridium sp. An173 TaxID=1965571 RepID=UPI000B37610F|nr:DNA topoisomerase IV subunit A [Erysipelatoclostridium sp. An173]OUP79012.1 DNA topoisomerase IV subunit A [Erysipelatoclostridium sp. An173]